MVNGGDVAAPGVGERCACSAFGARHGAEHERVGAGDRQGLDIAGEAGGRAVQQRRRTPGQRPPITREELVRAMTTAREGLGEIGLAIGQDVDGERAARVDRGDER